MTRAPQLLDTVWPADFCEQFWRAYPRRVAKKAAMKALDRVRGSGEVSFKTLLEAVWRYAESVAGKDPQFICHPATWLNGARWDDEYEPLGNHHGKISNAQSWADRRRGQIESQAGANRPRLIASNTRSST